MSKNLKPLVINTGHSQAAGSEFVWNKLQSTKNFIRDIQTPDVNAESSEELNRLVSGIPTAFARPAMFKYAINYVGKAGADLRGLMSFYKTLQDEWKGLVACLALDNQPITVQKVKLEYSKGSTVDDCANIYEPKGALGNMLFDDMELWCDPLEQGDGTQRPTPCICIIRYNGIVVGGTSPESFLFTAPVYDIRAQRAFYSDVTKRFTNPKANLTREEMEKLCVYVQYLAASMDGYRAQFPKKKPELQQVAVFLRNWLEEIDGYVGERGYAINKDAVVPNLNKFKTPFDKLFNFQTTLYGYGGRISTDREALQLPDGIVPVEVELAELLLNPDTCTVAEVVIQKPEDAALMGVHLLRALSDTGVKYFTLPISEKGLAIFQDELEGLLQDGGSVKSYLSGILDKSTNTLHITLAVDVNGSTTSFRKSYKDPIKIQGSRVVCWPNFVSEIWSKYYLYSELPHNGSELRAFPLRADKKKNGFRLLADEDGARYQFRKIAVNGSKLRADDPAKILVEYDMNRIGSAEHQYEIYESPDPFKGIELQFKGRQAGYVLFKSLNAGTQSQQSYALKDFRSNKTPLDPVRVGFDFGSNNICISYAKPDKGLPLLIAFQNRRRSLLGVDTLNRDRLSGKHMGPALPNEVFFFQEEQTESNQIKSMVMIHDERRIRNIEPKTIIDLLSLEVTGGFPVFGKNISIDKSEETTYTTWIGQESSIKYNMKWSNDEKENSYKQGLLRVLWLKTCAELLDLRLYAESLVWAYPSSMGKTILKKYSKLWGEVAQLNPVGGGSYPDARVALDGQSDFEPQTEAASVCKYALEAGFQCSARDLIIGLDVGGSTTDILCVASRRSRGSSEPDDYRTTLIKEGSIRFAAGRLADATKKSKKFQEVLRSFCRKKGMSIHGITAGQDRLNGNTSSYYFNLIVDQLNTAVSLNEFYRNLSADCPDLFTVNAFMTGLIMFYAGQVAYGIRMSQENPESAGDYKETFDDVRIGCFGKGGRMFDWLRAMNKEAAEDYYRRCFDSGYGVKAADHIDRFKTIPSDMKSVKAEVSFGLSSDRPLDVAGDTIAELVGEEGYTYNGAFIDEFASIEPRFLQNFGNQFSFPREFKRFSEFANIFRGFAKEHFDFSFPTMEQEIRGMRLKAYIENIPDYQLAKRNQRDKGEFDFKAPIVVLEGMCFLDTVLSQRLFGQ